MSHQSLQHGGWRQSGASEQFPRIDADDLVQVLAALQYGVQCHIEDQQGSVRLDAAGNMDRLAGALFESNGQVALLSLFAGCHELLPFH